MSETPLLARLSPTPDEASIAIAIAPAAKPSSTTTPAANRAAPEAAKSRPIWPWILIATAIGGGAGAYVLSGPPKPLHLTLQPSSSASAHPIVTPVRPLPSASTSATIAASAAPIPIASSAVLPPVPVPIPGDMTLIAAGTFTFGEGKGAPKVTISRPFYLDQTEVTVRAYQECVTRRQCSPADHVAMTAEGGQASAAAAEFIATWTSRCNAVRKDLDGPINCVDFTGAEAYCKSRGRRLPTEAEWELAARGSEGRVYAWGEGAPDCGRACYDKNGSCLDRTAGVSTCGAGTHATDRTPEGVFDLGGGVAEWVSDGFVTHPAGGVDPVGDPAAPLRVIRGASFLDTEEKLRASTRTPAAPVMAHVTIGFRCALDTTAPAH